MVVEEPVVPARPTDCNEYDNDRTPNDDDGDDDHCNFRVNNIMRVVLVVAAIWMVGIK